MSLLWPYLWPALAAGLVIGAITGRIAFRRRRQFATLLAGVALAAGAACLWHGPLGAADRFTRKVERLAGATLAHYEMAQVSARLDRGPLSRTLLFKGPADDFQRSELQRLFSDLPGVSQARWSDTGWSIPLIVESVLAALAGFLTGAMLAYVIELRRRYNAQWTW